MTLTPCQIEEHLFTLIPAFPSTDGEWMYVRCTCGADRRVARWVYAMVVALDEVRQAGYPQGALEAVLACVRPEEVLT